jgi:hypothetical protein
MQTTLQVLFIFNFELMRQFGGALGRFTLILLLVCVLACLVYREALRRSFEEYVSNSRNIRVLVLGDSHPVNSINTVGWDGTFNFASGGEWLPYNYIKLEVMSEYHPDLEVVILGLSYHSFAFSHEEFSHDWAYHFCFCLYPFKKDTSVSWKHFMGRAWLEVKQNHSFGIITKNAIPDIKNAVLDHRLFIGASTPPQHRVASAHTDWELSIKSHYFSPELKLPSSLSMTELYRIKDLCLQKGYKLILYNTPVPRGYFEHIPPVYNHLTDSIACAMTDNQNVYYLNYSQYPLPDSCFADGDHTNIYGARIITSLLRDSLAALGVIPTNVVSLRATPFKQ